MLILFFKKLLFLLLILNTKSGHSAIFSERMKRPDSYFLQKSILNLVSTDELKKDINEFLAQTYPSRSYRSQGHTRIAAFFREFEKENNIQILVQDFSPKVHWAKENLEREFEKKIKKNFPSSSPTYQKWSKFKANIFNEYDQISKRIFQNYVWKKNGTDANKTLIISANIDSIGQGENKDIHHDGEYFGATDNASSVIALLKLITVLNKVELPFNVIAVFFDLQEFGNLGSHAFVNDYLLKEKPTNYFHINSLMLSKLNTSKNQREFYLYGLPSSFFGTQYFSKVANLIPEAKIKRVQTSYVSSDSGPFIDAKIPSLTLLGLEESEQNQIMHQVSDTVEMIDFYHYGVGIKVLFSLVLSALYPL